MDINIFNEKYKNWRHKIENNLSSYVALKDSPESVIYQSMRYSLMVGGKRIRPVLMLAAAEMFDVDENFILPFACAIEMIHTYSLIHDDLPAMDDDDMRRGMKTNHIVYGEDIAILAGDALLNKAFEIMTGALEHQSDLFASVGIKMMREISSCAGTDGMIAGQVVDLESENKDVSYERLKYMYERKTGALLKASCTVSAICRDNGYGENYNTMVDFAENLGVAFQIKDDILDVNGDSIILGKETGSDAKCGKSTFVRIFGLAECEAMLADYTEKALTSLEKYGSKADFMEQMAEWLLERNY